MISDQVVANVPSALLCRSQMLKHKAARRVLRKTFPVRVCICRLIVFDGINAVLRIRDEILIRAALDIIDAITLR